MKNEYGISALPKSNIKDSAHFHNLNPPDKLNLKKNEMKNENLTLYQNELKYIIHQL